MAGRKTAKTVGKARGGLRRVLGDWTSSDSPNFYTWRTVWRVRSQRPGPHWPRCLAAGRASRAPHAFHLRPLTPRGRHPGEAVRCDATLRVEPVANSRGRRRRLIGAWTHCANSVSRSANQLCLVRTAQRCRRSHYDNRLFATSSILGPSHILIGNFRGHEATHELACVWSFVVIDDAQED
jgi:hypothetical protein